MIDDFVHIVSSLGSTLSAVTKRGGSSIPTSASPLGGGRGGSRRAVTTPTRPRGVNICQRLLNTSMGLVFGLPPGGRVRLLSHGDPEEVKLPRAT